MNSPIEYRNKVKNLDEIRARNVIAIRDIKFRYSRDASPVLNIEHLMVEKGQRVAIIGPSGAGKTTLMRLINGFIQPESGEIEILGVRLRPDSKRSRDFRRRIGFVFQNFNLIDRATVFENVLWGRLAYINSLFSMINWFTRRDKEAALKAIEEVNLVKQINQRADTLSGGQLQRVAIARAIAQEPEIILADEPVSNLDPSLTSDIMDLLVAVSENHGVTLLMNLHQVELAQRFADRVVGLRNGEVVYDSSEEMFFNSVPNSIFDPEVPSLKLPKDRN
ncbi:MAG: phosphonate ABC transporter ATP-binding protein [Deltaproteobacteria bacterium]